MFLRKKCLDIQDGGHQLAPRVNTTMYICHKNNQNQDFCRVLLTPPMTSQNGEENQKTLQQMLVISHVVLPQFCQNSSSYQT